MRIGYHISISEGLTKTAKKILEQKLTAVQIFPGSPKNYFPGTKHTTADFQAMKNLNMPKFVHINYFVNPAGDTPVIPKSIAQNMIFCDKIGATGLVIHMGSNKKVDEGMKLTIFNIEESIKKYKELSGGKEPEVKILIETTSEGGNRIKWSKIIELVKSYKDKFNMGIVVDTCHLYSAGYTSTQILDIIDTYHDLIELIHLNNPSPNVEFGKHKDQHDIPLFDMSGKFSKLEIENFLTTAKSHNIPCVTETGDEEEGLKLIIETYQNF